MQGQCEATDTWSLDCIYHCIAHKDIALLQVDKIQEESRSSLPSAEDHAPRQYSCRASAALTAKLLVIGGGVLALLWMLDVLLAP
jgi:signal transduction histidine kinase